MNKTQTQINPQWLKSRQEQIQKEKEENSKYLTLKNGENVVKIDLSVLPLETMGKYGKRFIYTTMTVEHDAKNNTDRQLLLSASPTLDALIVKALAAGVNPFTIVKVGEGKETRYGIKELDGEKVE